MSSIPVRFQATVHTWPTRHVDAEGEGTSVGHTALTLERRDPSGDVESKYLSVRPKNPLSVNPITTFLGIPVRATHFATLERDRAHEMREPESSRTLSLDADQYAAMKGRIENLQGEITDDQTRYSLLPQSRIGSLFRALSTERGFQEISRCPFSGHKMEDDGRVEAVRGFADLHITHCASSVADVLNAGGVEVKTSRLPWKITPTELESQLPK